MKLNDKKVRWIIKKKKRGMSTKEVAREMRVSIRRVQQVWREFCKCGVVPAVGKNMGRPKGRSLTQEECGIIMEARQEFKFGASLLKVVIRRRWGVEIPLKKIHAFLKEQGLAKEEPKKKRKRKWVRYEYKHSMSAGHMDWHEREDGTQVCIIVDDSSRMILGYGEFDSANEANSISLFNVVVERFYWLRPLGILITDHGCQFGAHRVDENGKWDSEFKQVVESHFTKIVLARVNHPQTNGKVEKLFDTYERFRDEFQSMHEFVHWYNTTRPHMSLNFERMETPEMAFWRRLPDYVKFALANRILWGSNDSLFSPETLPTPPKLEAYPCETCQNGLPSEARGGVAQTFLCKLNDVAESVGGSLLPLKEATK